MEPTFYLITFVANSLFDDASRATFLIYAFLGVTLKIIGICRLSPMPLLSVILYICSFYPSHELAQIRVGVASAIFLLAIPDIINRNSKTYFIKAVLAILFHYSALIMLIVYPMVFTKNNRFFLYSLPLFGIIFALFNKLIIDFIILNTYLFNYLPSILSYKFIFYVDLYLKGFFTEINVFNFYYLSLVLIYYFCIMNIKRFKLDSDIVLMKILGLSLFTFYALSFLPVFALRISEFLQVVIIILLPSVVYVFKQKVLIIFIIINYFLLYAINLLFVQKQFDLAMWFT